MYERVTIKDFMERKNCSKQTVFNAIKKGLIHSEKQFHSRVIILDSVTLAWEPKEQMRRK